MNLIVAGGVSEMAFTTGRQAIVVGAIELCFDQ